MTNKKPLEVFKTPLTGISLVEASAGTGKTYSITSLYIRALLEKNLEPSQILVVTFTEAATAELKSRIRNRIKESIQALNTKDHKEDEFLKKLLKQNYVHGEQKLKSALEQFDEAAVFTIHGFCNRILNEFSLLFDVPPRFELLTDASELLQECVDDYWRTFLESTEDNELKWFTLDLLTDAGFGPDELRKIIEDVIKHPRCIIEPEHLSMEGFDTMLESLKQSFQRLQTLWEKEGDVISDMYLNGKLNGNTFQVGSNTWETDWQNLLDLLASAHPKIQVSDRMVRFGSYMREKGGKSSFEVPDLDFFGEMDTYIGLTDSMKLLKTSFIKASVNHIKSDFRKRKRSSNNLTYNDLLEVTEKGLIQDEDGILAQKLRSKYPLALVDEFQDTDPVQYGIFRKIYHLRNETGLFMIGDPKQAIYAFRGADIFTYLSAKSDADKDKSYNLIHNYRSNRDMINGINALFLQAENPFLLNGMRYNEAKFPEGISEELILNKNSDDDFNPLQFITLSDQEYSNKGDINDRIYNVVSNEVMHLLTGNYKLNGRDIEEKDIAILVREGREGDALQDALRSKGISTVLRSRSSVFKTQEAEELLQILGAIQKISYEPGIRAALVTTLLGYTAGDLLKFEVDEVKWSDLVQKLNAIKSIWNTEGIDPALDALFHRFNVIERLSARKAAERKISNLIHVSELLSSASRSQKLNAKSLLKWFFMKVNEDTQNASSEEEELRLESDEDLVQIITMHSSKGLEFPIVFCPFLWSSKSSMKRNDVLKFHADGAIHVDISKDTDHDRKQDFIELTEHQNRAEDVRLTYVALTRAISACYVLLPNYNKIKESPLAYLLNGDNGYGDLSTFESIANTLKKQPKTEVRMPVEDAESEYQAKSIDKYDLHEAKFERSDIFHFSRMLSYSSLSSNHDINLPDELDYGEISILNNYQSYERKDPFGFPRGANAGTFLHKVFEDIVFSDHKNIQEKVIENLNRYGIDPNWEQVVIEWVRKVLNHPLLKPDTALNKIPEKRLLKEMEFFFPVSNIQSQRLWELIRPEKEHIQGTDEDLKGFMKGFIDLIFVSEGKYYILDYKSNHLGNHYKDYSQGQLYIAMKDAGYDLQYHIYTLALHRYLKSEMRQYRYEKDFGGVLYMFLRGVNKQEEGSGIYFHKPDFKVINKMDQYFIQGRS
ncbi:MAG: exodeoxyribonuclease V subunit beta [Gracilimonas sp.]|nr:exodeoxyribonuclease V subunit beta [Gracilimonas sp.]